MFVVVGQTGERHFVTTFWTLALASYIMELQAYQNFPSWHPAARGRKAPYITWID